MNGLKEIWKFSQEQDVFIRKKVKKQSKEGQWEENVMIGCCANHSPSVTKTAPKACVKGFEASLCSDWEVVEPLRGGAC